MGHSGEASPRLQWPSSRGFFCAKRGPAGQPRGWLSPQTQTWLSLCDLVSLAEPSLLQGQEMTRELGAVPALLADPSRRHPRMGTCSCP